MEIKIENYNLQFELVEFEVLDYNLSNLFNQIKTNKSITEEIRKVRYKGVYHNFLQEQPEIINRFKIGEYIMHLKTNCDERYRLLLNNSGDRNFCKFRIENYHTQKGIYCFSLNDEIKYFGKAVAKGGFSKRINSGYGNISPYKTTLNGNSTNCHINSLFNEYNTQIKIYMCQLNNLSNLDIENLESNLIRGYNTRIVGWNRRI